MISMSKIAYITFYIMFYNTKLKKINKVKNNIIFDQISLIKNFNTTRSNALNKRFIQARKLIFAIYILFMSMLTFKVGINVVLLFVEMCIRFTLKFITNCIKVLFYIHISTKRVIYYSKYTKSNALNKRFSKARKIIFDVYNLFMSMSTFKVGINVVLLFVEMCIGSILKFATNCINVLLFCVHISTTRVIYCTTTLYRNHYLLLHG